VRREQQVSESWVDGTYESGADEDAPQSQQPADHDGGPAAGAAVGDADRGSDEDEVAAEPPAS